MIARFTSMPFSSHIDLVKRIFSPVLVALGSIQLSLLFEQFNGLLSFVTSEVR